jgi:hypothetical protein
MTALRRLILYLARGVPREDYYSEIAWGTSYLRNAQRFAEERDQAEAERDYCDGRLAELERAIEEAAAKLAGRPSNPSAGVLDSLIEDVLQDLEEVMDASDSLPN